jgi:site-specific DNA-methyltransferase (adenine-specific)
MINIYNQDCLEAMKEMSDNQFELAIVDPPYGGGNRYNFRYNDDDKKITYDNVRPSSLYFKELFRVSKNQIVWGGNYFTNDLPENRGWICWDKKQPLEGTSFSHFELAWTSFDKVAKMVVCANAGFNHGDKRIYKESTIHPTQKPISLYHWVLRNYAKKGDTILDTHLGSGSIAVACNELNFDLTAYEINKDYFEAAKKRIDKHKRQLRIL